MSTQTRIITDDHLNDLPNHIGSRKAVVVTDETVNSLYGHLFPDCHKVILPPKEEVKTISVVRRLLDNFAEFQLDRSGIVVGIGGGTVSDVAGFAASIFMRGVSVGFVPTTLLAQADAAIGGKNGVNLGDRKNMIGTITHPEFVLMDYSLLATLNQAERICGMAEIIKTALVDDHNLFEEIENMTPFATLNDEASLGKLATSAAKIKAKIVCADAGDTGIRRLLNFGHTLGHAVERINGLQHGCAVALGMSVAVHLSVKKNYLDKTQADRIWAAIESWGLPFESTFNLEPALYLLNWDKKRSGTTIAYVLLKSIGKAHIVDMEIEELKETLRDLY